MNTPATSNHLPCCHRERTLLLSAPSPHAHVCSVASVLSDCLWPWGCSVYGILQARMGYPPPGYLLHPGIKPTSLTSLALEGGFFTTSATSEPYSLVLLLVHAVCSPQGGGSHSFWTQIRLCCSTWNPAGVLRYIDMKSSELAMICLQNPT